MLVANMYGTLMSEDLWANPQEFRPERFIKDGKIHVPHTCLPFGFGKHRCMGETLAKGNVFLFTTFLLQKFKFEVPAGAPRPATDILDGVTPSIRPYNALVSVRF